MSRPNRGSKDAVSGISLELMAASSSLYMPAEERPHGEDDIFLADTDENVHHAIEHLHAAVSYTNAISQMQRDLNHLVQVARILLRAAAPTMDPDTVTYVRNAIKQAGTHQRII